MDSKDICALAVDDDPAILALLEVFLRARGYQVSSATNGELAWQAICTRRIDLVVTDWVMPVLDGVELCRRLREHGSDHYIYVVMLTAQEDPTALQTAMQAGVDDFLHKPFRPGDLAARLHAANRVLTLHESLAVRNRHLQQAYAQLSQELELAREMQLQLLPPPGSLDRVRFDWFFEASHFVGGDVFHYFPVDEDHACFYLIDVAGHGVPAALLAFHAQHQIVSSSAAIAQGIAGCGGDLALACGKVVGEINRRFLAMEQDASYLTMIFGLLDTRSGRLAFVQAGHPPPLYFASASAPLQVLGDGGLPIGIMPDAEFEAQLLQMAPGSRLYLYSDGVTDCVNGAGEHFGQQRLEQALAARHGTSLAELRQGLRDAIWEWRGPGLPITDDITFLALEYA